jgi:phosphoribosylglycinamide formyltransferase-1
MSHFKLAILASGNGSNAAVICHYFKNHPKISVTWIGSNKQDAYVLQRARDMGIESGVFNKQTLESDAFSLVLKEMGITHIILAGFLLKIPLHLVHTYADKIINIHPALLPKYGGKGMYGHFVHEAVIEAGDKISGITIHLVNEKYDEGRILFQASCEVSPSDSIDTLTKKIHQLEHRYFSEIIEDYVLAEQDSKINNS